MGKRVVGIAIALLLAAIGTVALVAYVQGAEERARAGEELVEVYVVETSIAAGTPGDELATKVRVEAVPAKVQALGAIDSLQALAGQVAAVDLVPGEQLVQTRFIRRNTFQDRAAGVIVPEGKVEVTLRLDPERAVGGLIAPGDTVAVIGSFDPFDIATSAVVEVEGEEIALPDVIGEEATAKTPNTSGILIHKALITAIQESSDNEGGGSDADQNATRLSSVPQGDLLVTFAVDPGDAERIVFAQEFGRIYLAVERESVSEEETPIQTRLTVYDDVFPGRQ